MSDERQLSLAERLVLFALSEDSLRTDSEISARVGIKESTVGMARRKLLKNNDFKYRYAPAFERLGFEALVNFYEYVDPSIPVEERITTYGEFFRKNPEMFDVISGEGFIMASGAFATLANLAEFQDHYEEFFLNSEWPKGQLHQAIFPFSISKFTYAFDTSKSLNRIFHLDIPDPASKPMKVLGIDRIELTKSESRVMAELLEFPAQTDAFIARRLKRSRQSVTEIRNRFIEEGLLIPFIEPMMWTAEFGVLVYVRLKFNPDMTLQKKKAIAGSEWLDQAFYRMERNSEFFATYLFGSSKEYAELIQKYLGGFRKAGVLREEPAVFVISAQSSSDIVLYETHSLIRKYTL